MKKPELNFNSSPEIFRRAKELRKNMTSAEVFLWEKLRLGRLNDLKFRRQHPAGKFILDFYCHKYKLAIELDGEIHQDRFQKERDLGRDEELKAMGINILRFYNMEVFSNPGLVKHRILLEIEELNPSRPPLEGRS